MSARIAFAQDVPADKPPAGKFQDEQLGVVFPGALAGLKLQGKQVYAKPEFGYSLRYQGRDLTKADIYVYDMGISGIPNGHESKFVKSESASLGRVLQIMQKRGYYSGVKQLASGVAGQEGPFRFAWSKFEFFQKPGKGRVAGMRVSESFITGFAAKFVKIRLSYQKDNLAEGKKISARLAKEVADLLTKAATIRDPKEADFVIEVDPSLPKHISAPWLAYVLARQAYVLKHVGQYDLIPGRMVPKFEEEVQGRKMLAEIWAGSKRKNKDLKDKYLDELLAVGKAKFMAEYVWTYLKQPAWPKQPRGLRLKEFTLWRQRNLKDHKPETHGGIRAQRKRARPVPREKAGTEKRPAKYVFGKGFDKTVFGFPPGRQGDLRCRPRPFHLLQERRHPPGARHGEGAAGRQGNGHRPSHVRQRVPGRCEAKELLGSIIKSHPGTEAAKEARATLAKLRE